MSQIVRIGLDIAKRWFQVRGVDDTETEISWGRRYSSMKAIMA